MPAGGFPKKLNAPPVYFEKLGGKYLVTNDWGYFVRLGSRDFSRLLAGKIPPGKLRGELRAKGFLREYLDFEKLAEGYRKQTAFLSQGPCLHILVLTHKCNHNCVYCQTSSSVGADMPVKTAQAAVRMAFQTTSDCLAIEFQGGEPLLNWPALKAATKLARSLARKTGKDLRLRLVSNMTLMDEEKAGFLSENRFSVCASLDGPAGLHNQNRFFSGGDSHALTVKWIRRFQKMRGLFGSPAALLTITKHSLGHAREIVGEYARLGLNTISLRPVSPIGRARKNWTETGVGAAEFSRFYAEALDEVISLNKKGSRMSEGTASIICAKIFYRLDPGYLDLRSPCGACTGQLAYDADGSVYACDEGRMLAREGINIFKAGDAFKSTYEELVSGGLAKVCAAVSCLENQPACSRCVYKPYCGVCPAYNYLAQGSLWGNMATNERCAMLKSVFTAIFERIEKPSSRWILRRWAKDHLNRQSA